jgi:hypothetical protein
MRGFIIAIGCIGLLALVGCGGGSSPGNGSPGGSVTLNGAVNKGPFVTGSTVNVSTVNASGNPSGQVYSTQTLNDLGEFSVDFEYTGLTSLEGSGFYYNEALGELSGANITLRAFYNVTQSGAQDAHINIITHLSYNRVKTLMGQGSTFAEGVNQAETELKDALGIVPPGFAPGASGTEMNISGGDNAANAYLLATSAVFAQAAIIRQFKGGSIDANLQEILNTFGSDLQADGALNEDKVNEIAVAKMALDTASVKEMLTQRLYDVGSNASVPDLDAALDQDGDGHVNTADCLPLDATRWTGNADIDGDGHDSMYCGGDDCVDFVEGWHGPDCMQKVSLVSDGSMHRCQILSTGEAVCVLRADAPSVPNGVGLGMPYGPASGSRYISVIALYGSDETSCGIREDGALECWNRDGEMAGSFWDGAPVPPDASFTTFAATSNIFCGLDDEGALGCWGWLCWDIAQSPIEWREAFPAGYFDGAAPLSGPMSAVAVGSCQMCAISGDQTIQCWPDKDTILEEEGFERLAPPDGQFTSISMSQTGLHLCAVGTDNAVACQTATGVATSPQGSFRSVSAGGEYGPMTYACGVRTDGTVDCWDNTNGQTDVPAGTFLQVSTADRSACGLRTNGHVECWDLTVGEIPSE